MKRFQVADTLDGLLEELHYLHNQVEHADPIAANPDALREQVNENNVSNIMHNCLNAKTEFQCSKTKFWNKIKFKIQWLNV